MHLIANLVVYGPIIVNVMKDPNNITYFLMIHAYARVRQDLMQTLEFFK
jgi:hypothetical protein